MTTITLQPTYRLRELVSPADWLLPRNTGIVTTPEIDRLIAANAPVALGISGGKDSAALAIATTRELNRRGHRGPRICIHADLGRVEHIQSLPMCQRIADHIGVELVVVRRRQGDLMDRWRQRWADNVTRYAQMECVKLIMPWPIVGAFCRSELKISPICRYLVERFPGTTILNAVGIRGQESPKRAKAPIAKPQKNLTNATFGTTGYNWHPIHHWSLADVLHLHDTEPFPLHEHYTAWGASRVSCRFCYVARWDDLVASTRNPESHENYRDMVALEAESTFSFQGSVWLADVAPHLLGSELADRVALAKEKAVRRAAIEDAIPPHLLYAKGWPTMMPTYGEAVLLAEVRNGVAEVVGLAIDYTTPDRILTRYEQLMAEKARRDAKKKKGVIIDIIEPDEWVDDTELCGAEVEQQLALW